MSRGGHPNTIVVGDTESVLKFMTLYLERHERLNDKEREELMNALHHLQTPVVLIK